MHPAGLAYIAGWLLILTPDEDAFWIFVSLMDTYLRPWFSVSTIQMEVDGSLFSKTNDAQVANHISRTAACRFWLLLSTLPLSDIITLGSLPYLRNRYQSNTSTEFGTSSFMKVVITAAFAA
jgi:hypothetical protein